MIGTTAAILASAAIGAGATALASSNASKAANSAAQAQAQGAADATAEQRRQFDTIQQETAPSRQIGNAALGALGSSFGLPGYGNGAPMTGAAADPYYGYNVSPAARGVASTPMTGAQAQTYGDRAISVPAGSLGTVAKTGNAGTSPAVPDTGQGVNPQAGATPATAQTPAAQTTQAPDWEAFAAANPDVAQWAASGHGDPNVPIDQQSIEQRYAYWLQNGVKIGDTRASQPLPMKTVAAPTTGTQAQTGPAAGYTDPTAGNGYSVGARPDAGPSPSAYTPTARPMTAPLDVSLGAYQHSPGYDFQVSEAQRALGNVASANGGVYSGARLKAAGDRAVQMANTDYTDWRNYTTGQYNTDLARSDTNYAADRQFGYGQSRDARGDYVTDRTRTDGLYQDDRSYTAGRYDTRNAQLMGLAGIGTGATNTSANAAQSFATNAGNNMMTAANAKATGTINSANAWTSGVNNLLTTGAYLGGKYMTGGSGVGSYQPQSALLSSGGMDFGNMFNPGVI